MADTERKSRAEIIAQYSPQMRALLSQAEQIRDLTIKAGFDKSLYQRRDLMLGDFLTARGILNNEIGMTFIPVESEIIAHPYEVSPKFPSDFTNLTPYARNSIKVRIDLGPKRGGTLEVQARLNDIRTPIAKQDSYPKERRITDSLKALEDLNVTGVKNADALGSVTRTIFELIAIKNDIMQVSKGERRSSLEALNDRLIKDRILRLLRERKLPPEVVVSVIDESEKLKRLIITVPGVGDREFVYNPNRSATL